MKRLLAIIALSSMAASALCRAPNERAEIEAMYKSMSKAFAAKDAKGYTASWAPAIRWFPPRRASTTMLTKGRAELMHDLRVEFGHGDKISQDYGFTHFDTETDKATVDLAVSTTHTGSMNFSHTSSERHHWLKAGGRWWLSRIEAIG